MLEGPKAEPPAGVEGIAVIIVVIGVIFLLLGLEALLLFSYLLACFLLGTFIILLKVGRGLAGLKSWALSATCLMFAVILLLVFINPFASTPVFYDPFARAAGATICLLIICYLVIPDVRDRFVS